MDPATIFRALEFAARKHTTQRRKDAEQSPYINHPIAVAATLAEAGGVTDEALLVAAVLHDTVEDTHTSVGELEEAFGADVAGLVREVTDDKSLPKAERKARQVEHAAHSTPRAKQLKIADKICNIRDVTDAPPHDWTAARRAEYLDWAESVVRGCRGVNPGLERAFDEAMARAREMVGR